METLDWRKSRRSMGSGACAEVASCPCPQNPGFRKSSRSMANGNCAEVASSPGSVLVRDTKQDGVPGRTVLTFGPGAWAAFTARVRDGRL